MQNHFARFLSMPMLFDAEGGGFGGGGGNDNNGASSDGAAGGFADAGNASASFDGSVSAISALPARQPAVASALRTARQLLANWVNGIHFCHAMLAHNDKIAVSPERTESLALPRPKRRKLPAIISRLVRIR